MMHVEKNESPASFEQWKCQDNESWQAAYRNLQHPEKEELHRALLAEQAWVCCYCGREIDEKSSHIEHFRPQETYPERALDYRNLHASCIRETCPAMPLHCGHAKKSAFDESLHISPLDAGCEQRFWYTLNGQIKPTDSVDHNAEYMLDLLKLDIPALKNRRAEVLRIFSSPDFLETVSSEELEKLEQAYRRPNEQGKMLPFAHVLARYAQQLLSSPAPRNRTE